eukprot:m.238347 g.238347  ORF g.238347 m.238347 type:complete len:562 (+) comp40162_c1_seq9:141-1826(+)
MALRKQNSRLESFLKRVLPQEKYERLRCYESAVIVSSEDKRALRYVIVGHRMLYVSENPPKNLKSILDLEDIEDIALIQDFPRFLTGSDRENTHHVRISYRHSTRISGSSTPKGSLSPFVERSLFTAIGRINEELVGVRTLPILKGKTTPSSSPMSGERRRASIGENSSSAQVGDINRTSGSKGAGSVPASPSPGASPKSGRFVQESLLSWKGAGELDVYVLCKQSPLLMQLQAAVLNRQIEATAHFAQGYCIYRSPTKTESDETALFQQMKQQIFTTKSLEQLYPLIQELKTACERFFSVRKQFWRTADLLKFMLGQLETMLPAKSKTSTYSRADRLEFCIITLQALASVFRETETTESRAEILANSKDLISASLIGPLMSNAQQPPRKEEPLKTTQESPEIIELLDELTDSATAVLFELSLAAQYIACQSEAHRSFNICWLFGQIDSSSKTKHFVGWLMRRATQVLASVHQDTFPASSLILLYQQAYLLKMLLQYTHKTALHVKDTYAEEFRYYFQNPTISSKLPSEYPLTMLTLQLIEELVGKVSVNSIPKSPSSYSI